MPDQGPPGTGKTRTILGLLAIVLHASPHRVGQAVSKAGSAFTAGQPVKGNDLVRLWVKSSPWAAGRPAAR